MIRKLFSHLTSQNARSIAAGVVIAGTALVGTAVAEDPQRSSGTFYDQNRPVETGDAGLDRLLNGTQRDLSRDLLRSYTHDLEARLDRALHQVGELYNIPQYVREWMHDFMADERQRIGVANTMPSASQAVVQAVTNDQFTPTAMDQRIMDGIMREVNRRFETLPGFDQADTQIRLTIGEYLRDQLTPMAQPENLRQQIARHPWLGQILAQVAVDHPEVLNRAPWLTETLTPYIQQNLQQIANPGNVTANVNVNNQTDSAPVGTSRIVYDESAPRMNAPTDNNVQARTANTTTAASSNSNSNPNASPMTQAQFQASIDETMRRFQAADAANQANPTRPQYSAPVNANAAPNNGMNASRLDYNESAARQPRNAGNVYEPRNGYDAYGNRVDSPRQQYDAQGYYTNPNANASNWSSADFFNGNPYQSNQPVSNQPIRQNRVYNAYDGTSRPIGSGRISAAEQFQAVQSWSQNQIQSQQAGRSSSLNDNGSSFSSNGGSSQPSNNSNGAPLSTSRIVFDDNAPRQSVTGSYYRFNENAPRQNSSGTTPTATIGYNENAPRNGSRISPDSFSRPNNTTAYPSTNASVNVSTNQPVSRTSQPTSSSVHPAQSQPHSNVQHHNGQVSQPNAHVQPASSHQQTHTPMHHSNGPAVSPRTNGVQSNTANLGPAVSARANGVQPHTASLTGF